MAGGYSRRGPFAVVTNSEVGLGGGWYPINYHSDVTVNRGYSGRSDTIPSDHRGPTPYSREIVDTVADDPSVSWDSDQHYVLNTSYISTQVSDPAAWSYPTGYLARLDNAEDRSITIARDRLRQKDSFQTGVSIGEAVSTAGLIADSAGHMAKGLIGLRRAAASLSSGRDKLLALGGAWLVGHYGYGSLARDVFALKDRLERDIHEPLHIKSSCTSRVTDSYGPVGTFNEMTQCAGLVKVGYMTKLDEPFIRNAEGWGLINPLTIAWELVPYSFCLDWIIPVGNTLSALTADAGLAFESGYISRVSEFDIHRTYVPSSYSGRELVSPGNLHTRVKRFDRRLSSGIEPPRLYANENPFSTPRILSGLALISQAVLGR